MPIFVLPPSMIISILPLRARNTSFALVGGLLPEIFALGATTGMPAFFINRNATLLSGILKPIFFPRLSFNIIVRGPGQYLSINLPAIGGIPPTIFFTAAVSAVCFVGGFFFGRFFISYTFFIALL